VEGRGVLRVLLVGDRPQSFSLSRQFLERSGCECHFAGSLEAAKDLLDRWQFEIVLSMRAIPSETIQKLVGLLSGSGVSLFSSLRVEEGSWWLPVLQFGKESYGPALRVNEFTHVLDDLRNQVSLHRYASQGFGDRKHGQR
jgi:CheY-like chemotaxis protein